jgi:hypothetical protein
MVEVGIIATDNHMTNVATATATAAATQSPDMLRI